MMARGQPRVYKQRLCISGMEDVPAVAVRSGTRFHARMYDSVLGSLLLLGFYFCAYFFNLLL